MPKKADKKSKWSRTDILSLLTFLTPFLFYLLNLIPQIKTQLILLANKFGIPISILNLLIVLILFVILTLILYLRCTIKLHKKNSSYIPPSAYKTSSNPTVKLPPKKYMDKLLLRIGQEDYLTQYQIRTCFPDDDKTTIHHYIDLLYKSKHLLLKSVHTKTYELSSKGREYLVENNLLTKQT